MAKVLICDCCGKPTKRLAAKLWYAPADGPQRVEKYSHHLDVGECCHLKVRNQFNWRQRQSREQYHNRSRREVAT